MAVSANVLNRGAGASPAPGAIEPVELSKKLLREARATTRREQCVRLDELASELRGVEPAGIIGDGARIAFWANLYNALLLHRLCLKPVRGSMLRHPRLFAKVAYRVGAQPHTLNLIEHGLLRGNRRPPLHLKRPLRRSDPRLAAAPSRVDPRIHFALNCGARSCPPIRVYDPESLEDQLDANTRGYLEAETVVEPERGRVTLPRLMRLYAHDFGGRDEQLAFAARYLSPVRDCREQSGAVSVRYGRFDWTAADSST